MTKQIVTDLRQKQKDANDKFRSMIRTLTFFGRLFFPAASFSGILTF